MTSPQPVVPDGAKRRSGIHARMRDEAVHCQDLVQIPAWIPGRFAWRAPHITKMRGSLRPAEENPAARNDNDRSLAHIFHASLWAVPFGLPMAVIQFDKLLITIAIETFLVLNPMAIAIPIAMIMALNRNPLGQETGFCPMRCTRKECHTAC